MQILIPMGGAGSRFSAAGYKHPKPFIEFHGQTMIENVVENLGPDNEFFLVVQYTHYHTYRKIFDKIEKKVAKLSIKLLDGLTRGPADSCLRIKDQLDLSKPLMIANSDQMQFMSSQDTVVDILADRKLDGLIFVFDSQSPKNSYARINELGLVTATAEKEVISEFATTGIYCWNKTEDFVSAVEEMIRRDLRVNDEFYVAVSYNIAVERKLRVGLYRPLAHYPIGTPEDLENYLSLFPNGQ